jgi:hypothetical protein
MTEIYTYIYTNEGQKIVDNDGNFIIYSKQTVPDGGGFDYPPDIRRIFVEFKFPLYGIKQLNTYYNANIVGIKTFIDISKIDLEGIIKKSIFQNVSLEGMVSAEIIEFFKLLGIKSNNLVDYVGMIGSVQHNQKLVTEVAGLKSIYVERKNIIEGVKKVLTTDIHRVEAHKLIGTNLKADMIGAKDIRKLILSILNIEIN